MIDIDELERIERAATPGPWCSGRQNLHGCVDEQPCFGVDADGQNIRKDVWVCTTHETENENACQDTALIAAARNALPALIAELRAARAETEQLQVQLAGCGVAALGQQGEAKPGDYGWSASYGDVLRIRKEVEAARKLRASLHFGIRSWILNQDFHDAVAAYDAATKGEP